MPFNTALSGIRAANEDLRVTGNNIANASTIGFKQSRAEFGDIYSTTVLGSGLNQVGSGVRIQNVAQQFDQGNISFTENVLDLAVSGSGFFVTDVGGARSYTRAGTFSIDNEGFLVNNIDARLQGYSSTPSGAIGSVLGDLEIQTNSIQPITTTLVESAVNVDSSETVLQTTGTQYVSSGGVAAANFNGYTAQTLTVTDPQGNVTNVNTALNDNSRTIANALSALVGVSASATATATVSTWTSGLQVNVNGADLTNTDISQATADEITTLPGLSATYNAGAGTLSIASTIGDLEFSVTGSGGGVDELLTVAGPSGLAQTLEVDGASDGTTGNTSVSGFFTGGTESVPLNLATLGAGANDYDFTITVDGVTSAGNISLPVADYADDDAMAAALETAINSDANISGVSVLYDTDHFVFYSPGTGVSSTVSLTAVGANANDLGIATGSSTTGASTVVGGIVTLELEENYTLGDTSGTPIFDNPSTTFVGNAFDPDDPDTYNHSTSVTIYDSLGNSHIMQQFFIKQSETSVADSNHWQMVVRVDDRDVGDPVITAPGVPTAASYDLYFDANGALDTVNSDDILISNWVPYGSDGLPIFGALQPNNQSSSGSLPVPTPATSSNFQILMTGSTQVGSDFEVASVNQNGTTTGRLVGLIIDDKGIIFSRYTNGENRALGQVALAKFANVQGLQSLGDTSWAETAESGEPAIGNPGTGSLGLVQSGALEESNVELSEQLVNLIIAQRNFQASAKTIETADQTTQTIINLR